MVENTRFADRVRHSLRTELLNAGATLLADQGYLGLRMADVATRVGVSRQTVYNEFGGKSALVDAVVLRTTSEFLDGVSARLADAPDLGDAIRAAARYTIEHARENRLVAAALGTGAGEDLLPYLTTRGEPVLRASVEVTLAELHKRITGIPERAAEQIAETVVRLTLSHLVLETHTPQEAAEAIADVVLCMARQYSSTKE